MANAFYFAYVSSPLYSLFFGPCLSFCHVFSRLHSFSQGLSPSLIFYLWLTLCRFAQKKKTYPLHFFSLICFQHNWIGYWFKEKLFLKKLYFLSIVKQLKVRQACNLYLFHITNSIYFIYLETNKWLVKKKTYDWWKLLSCFYIV